MNSNGTFHQGIISFILQLGAVMLGILKFRQQLQLENTVQEGFGQIFLRDEGLCIPSPRGKMRTSRFIRGHPLYLGMGTVPTVYPDKAILRNSIVL